MKKKSHTLAQGICVDNASKCFLQQVVGICEYKITND